MPLAMFAPKFLSLQVDEGGGREGSFVYPSAPHGPTTVYASSKRAKINQPALSWIKTAITSDIFRWDLLSAEFKSLRFWAKLHSARGAFVKS